MSLVIKITVHFFFKNFNVSRIFNVPIEFVVKVFKGLSYDFFTKDWAARWNIKSGLIDWIVFFTFSKSLISTFLLSINLSRPKILKLDG